MGWPHFKGEFVLLGSDYRDGHILEVLISRSLLYRQKQLVVLYPLMPGYNVDITNSQQHFARSLIYTMIFFGEFELLVTLSLVPRPPLP